MASAAQMRCSAQSPPWSKARAKRAWHPSRPANTAASALRPNGCTTRASASRVRTYTAARFTEMRAAPARLRASNRRCWPTQNWGSLKDAKKKGRARRPARDLQTVDLDPCRGLARPWRLRHLADVEHRVQRKGPRHHRLLIARRKQTRTALEAANRARCTCGCGLGLAECVVTDMTCPLREGNIGQNQRRWWSRPRARDRPHGEPLRAGFTRSAERAQPRLAPRRHPDTPPLPASRMSASDPCA